MDEATARQRLERMIAVDVDPTLEQWEVDDILPLARRRDVAGNGPSNTAAAGAWAASTAVTAGTVVRVASTPVRYWRCAVAGVTAVLVPTWPNLAGRPVSAATVTDGSVGWEDAGTEWAPTWDLDAAAAEGWMTKAAKAAGRFDFTEDGQQFSRSQVMAHCRAMAESFRRGSATTLTTV